MTETNKIRILVADDHALVRAGICALLEQRPRLEVVAEAQDGNEALRLAAELQPDIVLMDIAMPSLSGLEATRKLEKEWPNVRVIILSMHSDEQHVLQALRAGAAGYLLKGASFEELDLAITSVVNGDIYLSPSISRPLVSEYLRRAVNDHPARERLSPRQQEVLQLIAEGKTTKQVALTLNVSVKTAETHRAQLMRRLGVNDVAGLVRYAIKIGLVQLQLLTYVNLLP